MIAPNTLAAFHNSVSTGSNITPTESDHWQPLFSSPEHVGVTNRKTYPLFISLVFKHGRKCPPVRH